MKTIRFNNNGISPGIKNKNYLKDFLREVFANEQVEFKSVTYIFCTDIFLLGLNQRYLNHDTYTDIITFTLSDKLSPIVSEIYISVERVKENSLSLTVKYPHELYRVMIHGILHLCGFSDHSLKEKKIMRQKEDFYLSKYNFT
ncbi:MAG TPA: rRNA maturation RNase YbeY [Ginsengibacter sp.]|nr:rRNA maturation RNase YbeY [Ginsengibacter sp.]